jgi:hypothetical protein
MLYASEKSEEHFSGISYLLLLVENSCRLSLLDDQCLIGCSRDMYNIQKICEFNIIGT